MSLQSIIFQHTLDSWILGLLRNPGSHHFLWSYTVILAIHWSHTGRLSFGQSIPLIWAAVAESLSRVRLCSPLDCSLPGFSVRGIFQARILKLVAISSPRGSSPPRDRTSVSYVSCIVGGFFYPPEPYRQFWLILWGLPAMFHRWWHIIIRHEK